MGLDSRVKGDGLHTFQIHGEIHHQIGTPGSEPGKQLPLADARFSTVKPEPQYKRYLQLWILQLDTVINPVRLWDMFREQLCNHLKRLQQEGILEHPTQDNVY